MATINFTPLEATLDGVVPVYTEGGVDFEADDDVIVPNDGRLLLIVRNDSAEPLDITAVSTATVQGLAVEDKVITCPAGETSFVYGFRVSTFGPALQLHFPAATDIAFAILSI